MDQPISCKEIYHIYKHPLSILIHLKFQDKDGCSRNGSRELLFNLKLEDGGEIDRLLNSALMDSREVPIELRYSSLSCVKSDDERIILEFKQLNLNIQSQFPIVQKEREAVTYIVDTILDAITQDIKILNLLPSSAMGGHKLSSVCGHVIGIYTTHYMYLPLRFTSSNHSQLFLSLTQLQYLRSLKFDIFENWEDQEQFYEEFGDQLGSKLVHLGISANDRIITLDILSNQMFKFSSLKVLKLDINSRDFNPSLELSLI